MNNFNQNNLKIAFILLILYSLIVSPLSNSAEKNSANTVLFDRSMLGPYIFSFPDDENIYTKISNSEYVDPLAASVTAISFFLIGKEQHDQDKINKGMDLLNYLIGTTNKIESDNSTVYTYNTDHGKFLKGRWWSGMSNASVAYALTMGYEITKEEKYKLLSFKAINGLLNTPKEYGSSLILNNCLWYEEFVNSETNLQNAHLVLNGFTFALISLKKLSDYYSDEKLKRKFKSGLSCLESNLHKFSNKNGWLFYMLNPIDIESMHYAIFDLFLLKTIQNNLNVPSKSLKDNIDYRESVFKKHFGLFKDSNDHVYFNAVGIPYPYWVDIYKGRFTVYCDNLTQSSIAFTPNDRLKAFKGRVLKDINVCKDSKIKSVSVYQEKNGIEFMLFEANINEIPKVNSNKFSIGNINIESNVLNGGTKFSDLGFIGNKNTELRLQFKSKDNFNFDPNQFLLINYQTISTVSSIQILLIDEFGKSISSYYPKPTEKAEIYSILISPYGFDGYDENFLPNELRLYFNFDDIDHPNKINIDYFVTGLTKHDLYNGIDIGHLVGSNIVLNISNGY